MTWWYEDGLTIYEYDEGKGWHYRPVKEERMEFDKSRCYSAINADELRVGDKVIVAYSLSYLKHCVECDDCMDEIVSILSDDNQNRFLISGSRSFPLAYLVERAENCTNCGSHDVCGYVQNISRFNYLHRCENYNPKTEQKNKKEIDMNWNYVNEGKLPTKQEMGTSDRVVVAVRGYNVPDVGYYDYELEAWFVDNSRYPVPVYAWHYDKPPREA